MNGDYIIEPRWIDSNSSEIEAWIKYEDYLYHCIALCSLTKIITKCLMQATYLVLKQKQIQMSSPESQIKF